MLEDQKLDRVVSLLEELVRWTKISSYEHTKKILEETLRRPEERLAFELTETDLSSEKIAETLCAAQYKVSSRTIINWWDKWSKLGLITVISPKRREKNFSLKEFNISIPELNAKNSSHRKEEMQIHSKNDLDGSAIQASVGCAVQSNQFNA